MLWACGLRTNGCISGHQEQGLFAANEPLCENKVKELAVNKIQHRTHTQCEELKTSMRAVRVAYELIICSYLYQLYLGNVNFEWK